MEKAGGKRQVVRRFGFNSDFWGSVYISTTDVKYTYVLFYTDPENTCESAPHCQEVPERNEKAKGIAVREINEDSLASQSESEKCPLGGANAAY